MSALKWEKDGATWRARSDAKAERYWTITRFSDGTAWHLRAPDAVGSTHTTLAAAKATALADHRMGLR